MKKRRLILCRSLARGMLGVALVAGSGREPALGQERPGSASAGAQPELAESAALPSPGDRPDQDENAVSAVPDGGVGQSEAERVYLLREGSYLVESPGELSHVADGLLWSFSPQARGEKPVAHTKLVLLPCSLLSQLQQLVESLDGQNVVIELTGQVTAYKGRNFLLLTNMPRVAGLQGEAATSAAAGEGIAAPGAAEGGGIGAQSASEAEQQLQRALSGRGRSTPRAASDVGQDQQAGDQTSIEVNPAAWQREGTILASRRGTIARDAGGAWVFAFDADAEGRADPPLVILPCSMLERIEQYARLLGAHAPMLLSGHIYTYEGRGYILPTAFRIPAEHSHIQP